MIGWWATSHVIDTSGRSASRSTYSYVPGNMISSSRITTSTGSRPAARAARMASSVQHVESLPPLIDTTSRCPASYSVLSRASAASNTFMPR